MENRPIRYVYMATPEESEKTLHKVVDLLVFWAKEEKRKEKIGSEKNENYSKRKSRSPAGTGERQIRQAHACDSSGE